MIEFLKQYHHYSNITMSLYKMSAKCFGWESIHNRICWPYSCDRWYFSSFQCWGYAKCGMQCTKFL